MEKEKSDFEKRLEEQFKELKDLLVKAQQERDELRRMIEDMPTGGLA